MFKFTDTDAVRLDTLASSHPEKSQLNRMTFRVLLASSSLRSTETSRRRCRTTRSFLRTAMAAAVTTCTLSLWTHPCPPIRLCQRCEVAQLLRQATCRTLEQRPLLLVGQGSGLPVAPQVSQPSMSRALMTAMAGHPLNRLAQAVIPSPRLRPSLPPHPPPRHVRRVSGSVLPSSGLLIQILCK